MRVVLLLCVFVYAVVGQDYTDLSNLPKYDQRYDYLDVDAIFTNKRLVRNYVECLINAARCTPEGKALKKILPEALRTKCIRCTERQKKTAVKVIKRLKVEYPEEWDKLSSRWDPNGDFTRYFEEILAKEHFNTIPGSGTALPTTTVQTTPPQPPPRVPAMPPTITNQAPATVQSLPPRPVILNRFGEDGELMLGSGSFANMSPRPMTQATTRPTTTRPATSRPTPPRPATSRPTPPRPAPPRPTPPRPATFRPTNQRPTTTRPPRSKPTATFAWIGVATTNSQATRFPLRPVSDLPPPISTAITLIDQIGFKIIKTTELFTDLLKQSVRAVVGR